MQARACARVGMPAFACACATCVFFKCLHAYVRVRTRAWEVQGQAHLERLNKIIWGLGSVTS